MTENMGGQRPYNGFGRSENTLQFNQPIELGGKRSARIAAGRAGVDAALARTRDGRLAYAYDLAMAYGAAEIAERRIGLAEDEVEEAEADLRATTALVEAGKEARLRSLQAETEVNSLRAELDTAKAQKVGAYARLAALAGVASNFTSLSEPLLARFEPRSGYGPIDPMQTAPYLAARAEQEAAEKRLRVARKQAIPDVTVSLGVRRLEVDRANAFLGSLSIPLPLFDRNHGNIDAAEADARSAEAQSRAAILNVEAETRAAMALNEAADARVTASDRTLKTAEETYRLARIAYEAGKSPLLELLTARHGLGVARGVVLDAAAARLEARARLARLQGTTITGEPVQ
jgi:cobalt-zinc-cadmium efflux system outer membrane protein